MESFSGQQYGWNDPSENQLIPHSFSKDYTNVTLSSSFTPQQIDESWLNRKSQLLMSPELEIGRITQDLTDWGERQTSRLGESELFSSGYSYTSVFPTPTQSIEQDIDEAFPLTQPESSSDLLTGLNIEVQNQEAYLVYVKQQALNQIISFSQDTKLGEKLNTAFGDGVKIEDFQNQMKTFELPEIRLISIEQLNAKGGFDGEKIYLAQELLLTNTTEAISVLIEELGHYFDQQLNGIDSLGDEGAIFAALVQNQPLTQATLAQYQAEDDYTSLILDGQSITIEQASLAGSPEITATTDIGEVLTIPDIGQTTTPILFQWTNKEAQYNSEVGYYLVDEEGRVDGIAPEDPDYASTVLNTSTTSTLFSPDQQTGDWQQIDIPAGYHLAFYLIANGTRNQWLNTTDPNHKPNAFFSVNGANLDGFDHSRTENLGTGIWRLSWEDLLNGGDQDFNDVVLTISQPGLIVPGQSRQNVPLDIDWVSGDREANVEMGFFFVDNPLGQIGALLPGDPGYAQAALSSPLRQTVFRAGQFDDGVELTLSSGQYIGWYLINGGTAEHWLSNNSQNHQNGPIALFSYASANPDGLSHLHYQTPYQLGWETSMGGGDKDYDDLVFRFQFGTSYSEKHEPFQPSGQIETEERQEITGAETAVGNSALPNLAIDDISVIEADEGFSDATFTVSLSQSSPLAVTVDYATQALSATQGTDYQPLSGQLTFAPGETQKTLTLAIYGDDIEERNETFALVLSQPVNAVLADEQAIVTIIDDEQEAEEDDDESTDDPPANPDLDLVNQGPTVLTLSSNILPENSRDNTLVGSFSTEDPDAGDSHRYSFVRGEGDTDNGEFEIVGDELRIINSPDFESKSVYYLRVKTTDAEGLSYEQTFTVDITNVNEFPNVDPDKTLIVLEDSGTTPLAINTPFDEDGDSLAITITSIPGQIQGSVRLDDEPVNNGQIITVDNLQNLTFVPNNNASGDAGIFGYTVSDGKGGNGGQIITLQISPINDPPTIFLPQTPTTLEATNLVIAGISVSDIDADNILITLNAGNGVISLNQINALTFIEGDGSEDNQLSFTGSLTNINAALNNLIYRSEVNFEGQDTLQITVNDLGNTGEGVAAEETQHLMINVEATNFDPVAEEDKFLTVEQDSGETSLEIKPPTDVDGDTLTITIETVPNEGSVRLNNTLVTIDQELTPQELTQLVFEPEVGYAGNAGQLIYSVDDGQGGSDSQTITFNVSPVIILREGNNFEVSYEQELTIPSSDSILRFTYKQLQFDLSDSDFINDAFEVALVDSEGRSLVHTINSNKDAFFNVSEEQPVVVAANVTQDNQVVALDLSGIAAGADGKLIFRLVNNDSDTQTTVRISNIEILADGGSGNIDAVPSLSSVSRNRALDFSILEDVSDSTKAEYKLTSFNKESQVLSTEVSLKNIGTYGLNQNLVLAVNHLSDLSVQVLNADGITSDGLPYYDFSSLIEGGSLDVGESSQSREIFFFNPQDIQFTYDLVVLSSINQKPIIESTPDLEVIAGLTYNYDIEAGDQDEDLLDYRLLVAPTELEIENETGAVTWSTTPDDIGNHNITVEVSDSRGGVTQQNFILSVVDPPPNRPPIFTTSPIVDTYINQLYHYDADAIDPDLDPLSFSLILGPEGMTINSNTGEVEWTPPPVLILGDTVLGQIGLPGETDEFTFSGVSGQQIYLDPLQYSGNSNNWNFDVYSPSGQQLVKSNLQSSNNQLIKLTETGTYHIIVDGRDDNIGSYGFSVIDLNLTPIAPLDSVIEGQLSPGSEDDIYRFTGNAGQKLFFDSLDSNGSLNWILYDSLNKVVSSSSNFSDAEFYLPRNEEYILAIRGTGSLTDITDYAFEIITSDSISTPLSLNTTVSTEIREKGEEDIYHFNLTERNLLYFDSLTNTSNLNWTLEGPAGIEVNNRHFHDREGRFFPILDLAVGDYTLTIDGRLDFTGDYEFQLLDLGTATSITPGPAVNDSLSSTRATQAYQFEMEAGQQLYFDVQDNADAYLRLVDPFGGELIGRHSIGGSNPDVDTLLLEQEGTYTLLVEGRISNTNNADVTYTLKVQPVAKSVPQRLVLNSPVEQSIDVTGEQDIYRFNLTERSLIYFDSLTNTSNLNWTLEGPVGVEVNSRHFNSKDAFLNVLDLVAGDYTLSIDGRLDFTGEYVFQLLDLGATTSITLGTTINDNLSSTRATQAYQFEVEAGQQLYFDVQDNADAYLRLVDPFGGDIFSRRSIGGSNPDVDTLLLEQEGIYTLLVEGEISNVDTDDISYILNIQPVAEAVSQALMLNSLVKESIDVTGEEDIYRFNLAERSRLYFDSLTNTSNLTWTLEGPAGIEVNSRHFSSRDSSFSILDLVAGDYTLTINGKLDFTGDYQFQLLDLGAATVISPETAIKDSLSSTRATQAYQFEVEAGQYIDLDVQDNAEAYWRLVDPFAGDIFSQRRFGIGNPDVDPLLLEQEGTYTLLVEGQISNADTADVNYIFNIQSIGNVPQVPTTGYALTLDLLMSGNFDTADEKDIYSFNLTDRSLLYFDSLTDTSNLNWTLEGPAGVEINSRSFDDRRSHFPILDLVAGDYTLSIDGRFDFTGDYEFQLLDLGAATSITPGTTIHDSLSSTKATKAYQFEVEAGQQMYFDVQDSANASWWLIDSFGNELFGRRSISGNNPDVDTVLLEQEGIYTLLVEGWLSNADTADVTYTFKVQPVAESIPQQLRLNSLVNESIDVTGEQDIYRFNLTQRNQLYFDSLTNTSNLNWTLEGPAGVEINSRSFDDRRSHFPILDLVAGDYTLTIDGRFDFTGDYEFQLLDLGAATSITPGTTIHDSLSSTKATKAYQFEVEAGQQMYFDVQDSANASWWLIDSFGNELFGRRSISGNNPDVDTVLLEQEGIYTLLVEGWLSNADTADVAYTFKVQPVAESIPQQLRLNSLVNESIDVTGEQDIYRFNLTQRNQLYFDSLTNTSNLNWTLEGPAGVEINSRSFDDRRSHFPILDLVAGDYTLTIDGRFDFTGDYEFQLLDLGAATSITPGTTIHDSLSSTKATKAYQFEVEAGQQMYFDVQDSANASWWLIDSFGNELFGRRSISGNNPDVDTVLLEQEGIYTLLVEGWLSNADTADVAYTFKVQPVAESIPQQLRLNSLVNESIDVTGEQDIYRFNLTQRNQLYFDSLTNTSNLNWTLEGPAGVEVNSRHFNGREEHLFPILDLVAGDYTLTIDGRLDFTGEYEFQLLDLGAATSIIPGITINDNLGSTRATRAYQFEVEAGQQMYFDVQDNAYASWRLIDSFGNELFSRRSIGGSNPDVETLLFEQEGTYTLMVEGWISNADTADVTYTLKVQPVAEALHQPLNFNTSIEATIDVTGEQKIYTFAGNPGQQLFFDTLTNNSDLDAKLYSPSGNLVIDLTHNDAIPFTLTEEGVHRLVIDGDKDTIGKFGFRLSDLSLTQPLELDVPILGTLENGNDVNLYHFAGRRGTILDFDLSIASGSGAKWVLFNPNNEVLARPTSSNPDFEVTLPSDGLYTLAIIGNKTNAADYRFQVTDNSITPIPITGTNVTVSGTVANPGDEDSYSFNASAGTLIWIAQQNTTSSHIRANLKNPDGTYAFLSRVTTDDLGLIRLGQTGEYTLETHGLANTIGNWQFQILALPADVTAENYHSIPSNTVVEGRLNPGYSSKIYSFDAQVGEQVLFNGMTGNFVNVAIVDPNSQVIYGRNDFDNDDSKVLTLSQSGLYHVLIDGDRSSEVNYAFQLLNFGLAQDIPHNIPVKDTLTSGRESKLYRIQGKANQRLFFDVKQESNSARIKVLNQNNQNILADTSSISDFELTLPETGDYTIYVEGGNSTAPIDYQLQIFAFDQVTDIVTPGDGENAANNSTGILGTFPVQIQVKDSQGDDAIQSYNLQVFADPGNGNPAIISSAPTKLGLNQDLYRYQLNGIDPDGDKLHYRLLEAPLGAIINRDTGELIWLTEDIQPGENYQFSVEVSDGRGGSDIQTWEVETLEKLGKIQGVVYEDLNANGIPDSSLVVGEQPDILFVIDVSGSMGGRSVNWSQVNLDDAFNQNLSPLDQELGSILALSEFMVAQGRGDISIGIVTSGQSVIDMNPFLEGIQVTTTPSTDSNNLHSAG